MPYVSQKQAGYFHTHKAQLAKQGVDVAEWDHATKGKHLPERVQAHSKGGVVMALSSGSKGNGLHDIEYASGGGQLGRAKDFKKEDPQGRGNQGRFLSTDDRVTGRADTDRVAGAPKSQQSQEDWTKPAGVGHTDADDKGDSKSLPPVKPRGSRG